MSNQILDDYLDIIYESNQWGWDKKIAHYTLTKPTKAIHNALSIKKNKCRLKRDPSEKKKCFHALKVWELQKTLQNIAKLKSLCPKRKNPEACLKMLNKRELKVKERLSKLQRKGV